VDQTKPNHQAHDQVAAATTVDGLVVFFFYLWPCRFRCRFLKFAAAEVAATCAANFWLPVASFFFNFFLLRQHED